MKTTEDKKKLHDLVKELEQRLAERTVELEAADRELKTFNYSVSHDLRGPLTIIDGFSKAVLEDYADVLDETGKDYLLRIRRACLRMAHLIDALQKLSLLSRETPKKEMLNLSDMAKTVAMEIQYLEPGRQVDLHIQEGVTGFGDGHMMRQALASLLGNAWKFTRNRKSAAIEFGMMERDGKKVYHVRDNGVGFDMVYADKLFVPFQRLHSSEEFEGNGIGLATVQRIIQRHGGKVWAEAEEGRGATFYFTLG